MQHRTVKKTTIGAKKPVVSSTKTTSPKVLTKDWKILPNKSAILSGLTSQAHKMYKAHNDQGIVVCFLKYVVGKVNLISNVLIKP